MPRISAAKVRCPRREHEASRVKLDGAYGKAGHRRQPTYMQASRVARDRARRFRRDARTGEVRESDHGQLVADWFELFVPVVLEPPGPSAWPAAGSLLLDHLPFRVRALDEGGTSPRAAPGRSPGAIRSP